MTDGPESEQEMVAQGWTVLDPATRATLEARLGRVSETQGADTFSHRSGYGAAKYGGKDLATWLTEKGGASLAWDEALSLAREVVQLRARLAERDA